MNKVEYSKKYRLEHKGDINFWFTKTYGRLKRDNKNKFNLLLPFSKDEFKEWINNNYKYKLENMLKDYKESNYKKDLCPSIDRIDDYKSYTFDNMQLITWKENNDKGRISLKNKKQCSEMAKRVWSKKVIQKDLDGNVIATFNSTHDVERLLGYDSSLIARACRLNKVSKGYRWEYVQKMRWNIIQIRARG